MQAPISEQQQIPERPEIDDDEIDLAELFG